MHFVIRGIAREIPLKALAVDGDLFDFARRGCRRQRVDNMGLLAGPTPPHPRHNPLHKKAHTPR
jgi:hypothetical protein